MAGVSRRDFMRTSAALTLAATAAKQSGCAMPQNPPTSRATLNKRPNIVLIMADDMGFSDIGCYGSEIPTPHIDRLAAEGLRMTQFYNIARCMPTRASLLTGLYPHQTGLGGAKHLPDQPGYLNYINRQCVTIAEVLRTVGYRTALAGKWHVGGPEQDSGPLQRGFEHYYGALAPASSYFQPNELMRDSAPVEQVDHDYYYTDAVSQAAVGFIDEFADTEAPFFLYAAYTAPHWPHHARRDDITRYRDTYHMGWDKLRRNRYERMIDLEIINPRWSPFPRPESVPPWDNAPNKDWQAERMAVYAAMVASMDRGVGRILKTLEQHGLADNTLVLFLSDNGADPADLPTNLRDTFGFLMPESAPDGSPLRVGNAPDIRPGGPETYGSYGPEWALLGNTPFRGFKMQVFEGGIATPLIARWPQMIAGNSFSAETGHVIDIMATCVDIAGAQYPTEFAGQPIIPLEGKSLLPTLRGEKRQGHEALYWEHEGACAVREGRWKLVRDKTLTWELYDLEADRTELNNLAGQQPETVYRLDDMYRRWAERCHVLPWETVKEL